LKKKFLSTILVIALLITVLKVTNSFSNPQPQLSLLPFSLKADGQLWHVLDIINPTLDSVEWIEEANYSKPPRWISSGQWYEAHSRQTLVGPDDIFVSLDEDFNWTAINEDLQYSSFDEFENGMVSNSRWWLRASWGLDADWLGIPLNRTRVVTEFNEATSRANVKIWCHITHIPEYILGEKRLENFSLTGFDLTALSVGSLDALHWSEDYTANGTSYSIYFKAPANILSQYEDTYSLVLDVSPSYKGLTYDVEQEIQISMPTNTEVRTVSPSNMSTSLGNIATFTIHHGDRYPDSFSVTSGPPIKDVTQSFLESAGHWLTEPSTWVAFATLTVLLYTAFSGKRIWSRRKTYYRLYRSMVNLYEHYALNFAQFYQEIENLSRSITKYFVEGKITDDQFDKLLTRRDDLIERAKKLQPPAPQKL
jgi:hypothetical protein